MSESLIITLNEPHSGQRKILSEARRFNVVNCGRRWGKTAISVNLLAEPALDGQPAGYFTPTYKLLAETYDACVDALAPIITRKHEQEKIELVTGGRIDFWTLENELAGRGRKYKRAILDEAAYCRNLWDRWTKAIRPTLTDLKGDMWAFSTPHGKNDFYKLYNKGKDPEEKDWVSWQMSTYTNPYIDPNEIDAARRDLPELAFAQEYLAEFSENLANPFGSDHIKRCVYPLSINPPVCFGIDLAKSFDYTVIIGLDANAQVCYFDRFQKDWHTTKGMIRMLPRVPMMVDSTGVGDPIVEELQRDGLDIEGFKYTSISKQQLMSGLQTGIQQRKIAFPEGPIVDELEIFEYIYTSSGVRYSAPAGFHDDCVNSLALAYKKYLGSFGGFSYSCA